MTAEPRALLTGAYFAALRACDPALLVERALDGWDGPAPTLTLAVGKAAPAMLAAARGRFPGADYLGVAPDGNPWPDDPRLHTAAHPLPDGRSVRAAQTLLRTVSALEAGDQVLLLLSGGGSALLCAPRGVTLEQKRRLSADLMRAGVDIGELNTVRRHLSDIKGGRLAQATRARVTALLLSDVMGDDPASVASGPAAPDPTTYADALAVLDRFGLQAPGARAQLERGARGEVPETLKPDDGAAGRVRNTVIGSGLDLIRAAAGFLEARGVRAGMLGECGGEAGALALQHARLVRQRRAEGWRGVLVSGGETSVTVRGSGVGGRNQEYLLALLCALREGGLHALSAGSDGRDGGSPAAGALLAPDSWARAMAAGLDPQAQLSNNDSGSFFARLDDALHTGPSGQNLNDLRLLWV